MTNQITLLTRLESSTELERRRADQCTGEVLAGWIAGAQAAISRMGSAVALGVMPRLRKALRSAYPFAMPQGEQ